MNLDTSTANTIANVGAATILIGVLWVGLGSTGHSNVGNWLGVLVVSFGLILTAIGVSQTDYDATVSERESEKGPDEDDEYRFDGGDDG